MKRRFLIVLIATLLMFSLTTGSAPATPLPPPKVAGYELSAGMDFWTFSDSAGTGAGISFVIAMEDAAYESAFGLYKVDGHNHPTAIAAEDKFEIFAKTQEPDRNPEATIVFRNEKGNWQVSRDCLSWTDFAPTFGFYYDVDSGSKRYSFYSLSHANDVDAGTEHIYTAYNREKGRTIIYLEDLYKNPDWDWQDMTVVAEGLSPQPVPEPATMFMFGIGLVGFAFITRRSMGYKR